MRKQKRPTHPMPRGVRYLLVSALLLYLSFTLLPAAVYGLSQLTGDKEPPVPGQTGSSETASQPPALSQASPTPSPMPAENTPAPETSSLPGFLDNLALPGVSAAPASGSFRIYDNATGQILEVSAEEFLPAALACEMDLSSPKEALKAQAVAIYTLYRQKQESGGMENGADFSCNTEDWLVYVTKEGMQARWGEDFDTYYATLREVCSEVSNELLTAGGTPICASYFAISCGSTESAENVWGGSLPYLGQVASPGDAFADGYLSSASYTAKEIKDLAAAKFPERSFDFSGSEDGWFQEVQVSSAGYVTSLKLGGVELTGPEARSLFSLNSACFSVACENGSFTFSVRGRGHGVGMSQAGAIWLAQSGAKYDEILGYYYPGTKLVRPD